MGDTLRLYRLEEPKSIAGGKLYPMVLLLHGLDGEAASFVSMFKEQNGSEKWFIVAPQAPVRSTAKGAHSTWDRNQDAQFLLNLLSFLEDKYPLDRKRIAVVGYSAGSSMALALAKSDPHRFFKLGLIGGGRLSAGEKPPGFESLKVFLFGAEHDDYFNRAGMDAAKKAFENAGAKVDLEVVPGTDHSTIYEHGARMVKWIYDEDHATGDH